MCVRESYVYVFVAMDLEIRQTNFVIEQFLPYTVT